MPERSIDIRKANLGILKFIKKALRERKYACKSHRKGDIYQALETIRDSDDMLRNVLKGIEWDEDSDDDSESEGEVMSAVKSNVLAPKDLWKLGVPEDKAEEMCKEFGTNNKPKTFWIKYKCEVKREGEATAKFANLE